MEKKHLLFLALLLAIPFTSYTLLRENIMGNDSYYYLSGICQQTWLMEQPPHLQALFEAIPCNIPAIKTMLFLLAFISLAAVAYSGELFHKNGWLAAYFIFLAPAFVFEFARLENEAFAIPLLFWANYYFLKGMKQKNLFEQAKGLGLIFLAGIFWQGAIYYILIYGLFIVLVSPFTCAAILVFGNSLVDRLFVQQFVWENVFGAGLIFVGVHLATLLGLVLEPLIFVPGVGWLLLTCFNGKFVVHALPFTAIATLVLYNHPKLNNLDKKLSQPVWETIKIVLLVSSFFILLVASYSITFAQPPTTGHVELVEEFVALQEQGNPAKNGWSYGYWVQFYGGTPTAFGGGEWDTDYNGCFALTHFELDCNLLNKALEMRLYDCTKSD